MEDEAEGFRVREMTLGEMLDDAYYLVVRNWKLALGVYAATILPVYLVGYALKLALDVRAATIFEAGETANLNDIYTIVIDGGAGILASLIGFPIFYLILLHVLGMRYIGGEATWREALRLIFPWGLWLLLANFLTGTITAFGTMLCLIPGLVAFLLFFLTLPVVALERVGPIAAMQRSVRLMRPYWAHLFIGYMSFSVISALPSMVIALVPNTHAQNIAMLFASFINPLIVVAFSLTLYYSARCKLEHFDLDMLARQVDAPEAPEGAWL